MTLLQFADILGHIAAAVEHDRWGKAQCGICGAWVDRIYQ